MLSAQEPDARRDHVESLIPLPVFRLVLNGVLQFPELTLDNAKSMELSFGKKGMLLSGMMHTSRYHPQKNLAFQMIAVSEFSQNRQQLLFSAFSALYSFNHPAEIDLSLP